MHDFKKLKVWRMAADLAVAVYRITERLPPRELYAMRSQLERAVISISANIAEGRMRGTDREFIRFLRIALGSTGELESLLLVADRLGYLDEVALSDVLAALDHLRASLLALARAVRAKPAEDFPAPSPREDSSAEHRAQSTER